MFNWNDLKIFLAISRSGSVRGAAKDLGTTHATLSRRLKSLEEELASPLFERGRSGALLTPFGEKIKASAEQAEKAMEEVGRIAFSEEAALYGPLRVSMYEELYTNLLSPDLAVFQAQNPGIELEIMTSETMSNLAKREADVALRITKTPPLGAVGRKLSDSPLAVYASSSYLKNRPREDRWISTSYEAVSGRFPRGIVAGKSNSARVARYMIREGTGIGHLPCFMGDTDPDLQRLPGSSLIPDNEIWALIHSDIRKNPRVRVLLDFIYKIFADYRSVLEGRRPKP
ncbi:MAG: LysR family transcriptional regulator [Sneathiella sp.]